MRAYQVFGSMPAERAVQVLAAVAEKAPRAYAAALAAAGAAMKARPVFLRRQPPEKRAEMVRRCLSRVSANALAEELLATYFVDCRQELLVEWLDLLGLAHEEGILEENAPDEPPEAELAQKIKTFLAGEDPEDRSLLLRAFAAQDAVDWPTLEKSLEG